MTPLATLSGAAEWRTEVKKSRFIARAASAETPEAAQAYLLAAAETDASHNCWAYRVGQNYRFSDDGEPAGTAGKPILQAIDGQGLDHVAVVVARYFGGIKLGAGGLIRAYGGCAALCLKNSIKIELIQYIDVEISCTFSDTGTIHSLLREYAAGKLGERFESDGILFEVRLPSDRAASLADAIRDATRGRGSLREHL